MYVILNTFHLYNSCFEVVDPSDVNDAAKLFSVPDFVGDACKAIASRVRGAVAGVKFDDFKVCICMYIHMLLGDNKISCHDITRIIYHDK